MALKNQVSVFSGLANIYSPYYRQMHIQGYKDNINGLKAFDFAYQDVENAFKYVHSADDKKSFILISCHLNEHVLLFHCENSYSASIRKHGKQMGLTNLKRRLALYYPDKHQFNQEIKADTYSVQLSIEL